MRCDKIDISLFIHRSILAPMCQIGRVRAMRKMATLFFKHCKPSLRTALKQYESNPTISNEAAIKKLLKQEEPENNANLYMMWLIRAAFYGDKELAQKIENWPFYKTAAYLPYEMLTGEKKIHLNISHGNCLRKAGFIGIPHRLDEGGLTFDSERGIYTLIYLKDFIPWDEDGFGAEWDYGELYFDAFFRRIRVKSEEQIPKWRQYKRK